MPNKPTKKKPLTPNQIIFANEWIVDRNGTRAYLKAYPSVKKEETARAAASRLLTNVKVKMFIDTRLEKIKEKAEINQEWVLERYKKLTEYTITDLFNDNGELKPLSEISEDALYAIQGLEVIKNIKDKESVIHKFKTSDKKGVLDSIAKLLGLVVDKTENRFTDKDGEDLEWKVKIVDPKAEND